jgi:hypothetical protein
MYFACENFFAIDDRVDRQTRAFAARNFAELEFEKMAVRDQCFFGKDACYPLTSQGAKSQPGQSTASYTSKTFER